MNKLLEKVITDILCFTELATPDTNEKLLADLERHYVKIGAKGAARTHIFPLSYIGPVEPFLDPFLGGGDSGRIWFRDATPRDVGGKWDISVIREAEPSWGEDALFQLTRYRRQPLHELRGRKILGEYANETSTAILKRDGSYFSGRSTDFYIGKDANGAGRWATVDYNGFLVRSDADRGDVVKTGRRAVEYEEIAGAINVALASQFNRDYEWTVTVAVRNIGNPVLLATDSFGAKQMFNDRKAEAGGRRAALEHWVSQHWRKSRKDPDAELFIRQHLRGAEEFVWKGFECLLRPSPYDLRLAAKSEADRKEMKREGRTVRLRGNHAPMV